MAPQRPIDRVAEWPIDALAGSESWKDKETKMLETFKVRHRWRAHPMGYMGCLGFFESFGNGLGVFDFAKNILQKSKKQQLHE